MSELEVRTPSGIEVKCPNAKVLREALLLLREFGQLGPADSGLSQPDTHATKRGGGIGATKSVPPGGPDDPSLSVVKELSTWDARKGICYLTAQLPPTGNAADDFSKAVLATLLAFDAWGHPGPKGTRLIPSLEQAGFSLPSRPHEVMDKLQQGGRVIVSGARRGRSYTLTVKGRREALDAFNELRGTIHGRSTTAGA